MNFAHERFGIISTIDPQTVANSQVLGDEIDMSLWQEIIAVFLTGNMANETFDGGLQSASTSGGSYSNITGKTLTQRAASASANDNLQFIIGLKSDEISDRYVKPRMITGGATGGPASCVVFGIPRIGPATDNDLSSVTEVVS